MKPVRLSRHATTRAFQRGTTEEQIKVYYSNEEQG